MAQLDIFLNIYTNLEGTKKPLNDSLEVNDLCNWWSLAGSNR